MKPGQQLNRVFTLKSTKCQRFITRRRSEISTPSVQTRQQPRETSLRNPGVVRLNVNSGYFRS